MDELWKHYAKWKKLETKKHIIYNFIYIKYSEQANQIHGDKVISGCQALIWGGGEENDC